MVVNPYLMFDGNCEEAFQFYKSVFGGEFINFSRFEEMPESPECKISEADKKKIMHVSLPLSKETVLMGSDATESSGPPLVRGNDFALSVSVANDAEADRIFSGLSAGGEVKMSMGKAFWGAYFGMLQDRFGVQWMVVAESGE